jgi:hypothetical protein
MTKYSDYNIIPLGDHCAIAIILKELSLRKKSYPFDWVTMAGIPDTTTIIYNTELIHELNESDNIDYIVNKYIGNALDSDNKINNINNIFFPHETINKSEVFEKYKRRFIRIKQDIKKPSIFILLTRQYYISKDKFEQIKTQLLNYNSNSIILFISGINHEYFENMNNSNIIFKYIYYDMTKLYDYDYTTFRPNIRTFLLEWFKQL